MTVPLSTEAKVLAAYLARHCVGREAARPQPTIRGHLAAAGVVVSERDFFDLEADLVAARVPVGTWGKGVYLCDDETDYKVAYGYLVSRFDPIRTRAETIDAMRAERFPEPPGELLFNVWGQEAGSGGQPCS